MIRIILSQQLFAEILTYWEPENLVDNIPLLIYQAMNGGSSSS